MLLAVEASTATVSLALCEGPAVLASRSIDLAPRQSAALIDALPPLLRQAGRTFSGLSLVAVGRGPGSYTGLRVALVAARAWALPFKIPVWTAPTPRATAARLFRDSPSLQAATLAGTSRRGLSWLVTYRRAAPGSPLPVPENLDSPFAVVPTSELPVPSLTLPPDAPPAAADLAFLHSLDIPSDPFSPIYLNPAVAIPPRYDALSGAPLA